LKKNALMMPEVRSNRIGLKIGFLFQEVMRMRFTRRSFRKVGVPLLFGVWTAVILSLAGCGRTPTTVDNGSQNVPVAGGGVVGAAPIVTSTVPVGNASTVSLNSSVTAAFSGTVDPTSIADNTFYLQTVGGTDHIPGTLSFVGGTAKFTPSASLTPSTSYLATVTGVTSLGGVPMPGDTKWIFSTTSSTASAGPTITATTPADLATGVDITAPITFTFSEDMDPSTLVAGTTVKLQGTGGAVAGTVSYTGMTGKFTPGGALAPATTYLFTVTTGVLSRFGVPLLQTKTVTFTTGAAVGTLAPSIISTYPSIDNAVDVPITASITFTFNQPIDPSTLVAGSTVKLQGTGGSVTGTVSYADNVGKFTPSGSLAPVTTYLFTVTTGVLSPSGVPMAQAKTLMFTTSASGPVAPSIGPTSPAAGDNTVPWDNTITPIIVTFSQDIDPSTLVAGTTIYLQTADGVPVPGTVSYTQPNATFTPNAFLAPETSYMLTVTTGVKNRSGIPMSQKFTLVFTTIGDTGTASLRIIIDNVTPSPTPSPNSTLVPKANPNITFTFNQSVNPATLSTGGSWLDNPTVALEAAGPAWVSGTVTLTGQKATFTPSSLPLAGNTTYVFTVTTGVKNLSGVGMAQQYKWLFTTKP
jgi:Bacterial Ig-like domain